MFAMSRWDNTCRGPTSTTFCGNGVSSLSFMAQMTLFESHRGLGILLPGI